MTLEELRSRHPCFSYDTYSYTTNDQSLTATFHFTLSPDIIFTPTITLPYGGALDKNVLDTLIFHLGLVESISYWKAACPAEFIVKAGYVSEDQIAWWHDLFMKGLGEFYFKNGIDFTQPGFLTLVCDSNARVARQKGSHTYRSLPSQSMIMEKAARNARLYGREAATGPSRPRDLILVGGGKDSAVSLELLSQLPGPHNVLVVNPTPAALSIIHTSKYADPIIVTRSIDPKLLELNTQGYLNGHTPFSALLAFIGVTAAAGNGFTNVIASNEQSASEGNVLFHGIEVNHQYSKSFEFEKLFREYCIRFLTPDVSYFSFLRPLYDLQIAKLFAIMPKYHSIFRSCNVGRGQMWCGSCPKCAFVYLTMSAFLSPEIVRQIFGSDFFTNSDIIGHITHLVGLEGPKPFECVGTKDESIAALLLAREQYNKANLSFPDILTSLIARLKLLPDEEKTIIEHILNTWNAEHFLPKEYEKILKQGLSK